MERDEVASVRRRVHTILLCSVGIVVFGVVAAIALDSRVSHWSAGRSSTTPTAATSIIPLASSPQSEWAKVTLPPNGRSEMIPIPAGMRMDRTAGDRKSVV